VQWGLALRKIPTLSFQWTSKAALSTAMTRAGTQIKVATVRVHWSGPAHCCGAWFLNTRASGLKSPKWSHVSKGCSTQKKSQRLSESELASPVDLCEESELDVRGRRNSRREPFHALPKDLEDVLLDKGNLTISHTFGAQRVVSTTSIDVVAVPNERVSTMEEDVVVAWIIKCGIPTEFHNTR
jgi:hypothetical protein